MSRKTKKWLLIAAALIVIGCVMFGGVMTMLKWDFKKLSAAKFETNSHEIVNDYQNITVTTDTADIVFLPAQSDKTRIICYEQETAKHLVAVKEDELVIELVDERRWYEQIENFGVPKIEIYLPQRAYNALVVEERTGDITVSDDFKFGSIELHASTGHVKNYASASEHIEIHTNTGNITVQDISAATINLSVTTGEVTASSINCEGKLQIAMNTGNAKLAHVVCGNLVTTGSTGALSMDDVTAAERFNIKRSTGHVKFTACDAAEIHIETSTGHVKGSLLTDKVFFAQTNTGNVEIPDSVTGGKCTIITNTGDICITTDPA